MLCSQLISQLQNIQGQYQELNQRIGGFVELKNSKTSIKEKSEYLLGLYQSRKELRKLIKELQREFFNPTIETKNYITVEGQPTQETEIKIDFETIINKAKAFYLKHEIDLPPDFEARAKEIWTKNYESIQKEIATYGYDNVLIIPDNLPSLAELYEKMTIGYESAVQSEEFRKNGAFSAVKNNLRKEGIFRLTLVHNVQNVKDHVLLKATEEKSLEELTDKSKAQIETIIANQNQLTINCNFVNIRFGPAENSNNNILKAEGLTLDEWLIFQREYLESTGTYMDHYFWTSLLSTYFAGHVLPIRNMVDSSHPLKLNHTLIDSIYNTQGDEQGCRLSRSFTL